MHKFTIFLLSSVCFLVSFVCCFNLEDSQGYAYAPGGTLRPKSCVHTLLEGEYFHEKLQSGEIVLKHIENSNYTRLLPACLFKAKKVSAQDNGWNVYASTYTPGGAETSFLESVWQVPTEPQTKTDQTIFIFNALQPMHFGSEPSIIQPVLQWGIGSAAPGSIRAWQLACWYVPDGGHTLISSLKKVSTGDTIKGTMQLSTNSKGNEVWTIIGLDETTNVETTLHLATNPNENWQALTLEAYSMESCSQYPASGSVSFTDNVAKINGKAFSPSWKSSTPFTNCGESVNINTDGSVTLFWD
mmetsp:Transcript_19295/g.28736  ORF Transcript_19295/g.28736 Transcript_19295/m.28736 type:complete len:300 (+) Transcript_19295:604-1503(+)